MYYKSHVPIVYYSNILNSFIVPPADNSQQSGCCVVPDFLLCMCYVIHLNFAAFHMSPDNCNLDILPVWIPHLIMCRGCALLGCTALPFPVMTVAHCQAIVLFHTRISAFIAAGFCWLLHDPGCRVPEKAGFFLASMSPSAIASVVQLLYV